MRSLRHFVPQVQVLDERAMPALLLQLSTFGSLQGIFGVPDGDVVITQTDDNVINVVENGIDLGTYQVDGELRMTLGNTNQALTHTFDFGSYEFGGDVFITLGNSNLLTILNVGGTGGAVIGGDLVITTGNGPDEINLSDINVQCSVTIRANGSADTVVVNSDVAIDGNLTVTGAQDFTLAGTVAGIFLFDSTREALANFVRLTGSSTVGGIAVINTGPRSDTINLHGDILDHAVVKSGNGNTLLNFTGVVEGNFTIVTGNNNDRLNLRGLVGGNLTIITNNGNDDVYFNPNLTVLGTFINVQMGNGRDSLTINYLDAPGARLMVFMGNGNDTVTLNAVPTLLTGFFDGGNGIDAFNSPGAIGFPIIKRFFP